MFNNKKRKTRKTRKKKDPQMLHIQREEHRWSSRKFYLSILALILIISLTLIGLWSPAMIGLLPTSIGGILGVLGLYFAGNITAAHVAQKYLNNIINKPEEVKPSPIEDVGEV